MASLNFSSVFDDDEDEEQRQQSTPASAPSSVSKFDDVFTDEEELPVEDVEEAAPQDTAVSKFESVFDDAEDVSVDEPVVEEPETPTQTFQRTGEVPEGFKAVPQVPTGDAPEDYLPRLEPIDAPTPTVSWSTNCFLLPLADLRAASSRLARMGYSAFRPKSSNSMRTSFIPRRMAMGA